MLTKITIGGAKNDILSWANHEFSIEDKRCCERFALAMSIQACGADARCPSGQGSMVGSVVATKEAVIPATVGVDIGCGMMAVKTPFKSGILDGKLKSCASRSKNKSRSASTRILNPW